MNELNDELRNDFQNKEYAYAYVEDFLNAEIATQIKVLREQHGFTQQQLAELAGMAQPRLSRLEDVNYGSWSIKTLKKLAYAFDVTLKVSFETFGSRIGDIVSFNRQSLQRTPRSEELSEAHSAMLDSIIVDMNEWARRRNRLESPRTPFPQPRNPDDPIPAEEAAQKTSATQMTRNSRYETSFR